MVREKLGLAGGIGAVWQVTLGSNYAREQQSSASLGGRKHPSRG
jgi:hypothetical protein